MFNNIYGNYYPKKLIESLIKKDRIVHTIIINGENGLGKLTFAKNIASQIVYNQPYTQNINNYIDINIINGNDTGSILINNIREIKNSINNTPHEGKKKVQIIANCDKMTIQAQNALLKSLEEPSSTTVFILTVSNKQKLLGTILSRGIIINMEPIPENQIITILSEQYKTADLQTIIRVAKISSGNLGLCKKILSTPANKNILDICEKLLFYILTSNEYEIMIILSKYEKDKLGLIFLLELFKLFFCKVLKMYLTGNNLNNIIINYSENKHLIPELKNKTYVLDLIDESLNYTLANVNIKLILAWLNINLAF